MLRAKNPFWEIQGKKDRKLKEAELIIPPPELQFYYKGKGVLRAANRIISGYSPKGLAALPKLR